MPADLRHGKVSRVSPHPSISRPRHQLMQLYCEQLGARTLRRARMKAERAARLEAEATATTKSKFIATMSHELRTPLNCIIGFAELLMNEDEKKDDAARLEYAGYIHESSVHLLEVVNSILDMSKIQSGVVNIDLSGAPLGDIASQCSIQLRQQAGEKQVDLACEIEDADLVARANETKTRQIVFNLLSNAIKFTRPGGEVAIVVRRCGDGGASIMVRDSGIGMSKAEMGIALTPFGQVDDGYARQQPGAGLGLSIARELTELQGGRFDISSKKGHGTVITLTFDLLPGEGPAIAAEAAASAQPPSATVPS
jgi:signal transduction histidine kinase